MFSQRLKEERERLKLSQTDFAEYCGVKKNAQIKYEKGERQPDSDYLQKAHKFGVDVSYLLTDIRTQPVALPSDEALLLDSFRALSAEQKRMALQFMLGGFERLKNDQNDDNKNNQGVIGDTTGDVSIDNTTDSSTDNSNRQGVFHSPNSPISNSFNTQAGFTEIPFLIGCIVCGSMAWLLAAVATYKMETDALLSNSFGSMAILLWVMAMVMAGFGYTIGKTKYDEVQSKLNKQT